MISRLRIERIETPPNGKPSEVIVWASRLRSRKVGRGGEGGKRRKIYSVKQTYVRYIPGEGISIGQVISGQSSRLNITENPEIISSIIEKASDTGSVPEELGFHDLCRINGPAEMRLRRLLTVGK